MRRSMMQIFLVAKERTKWLRCWASCKYLLRWCSQFGQPSSLTRTLTKYGRAEWAGTTAMLTRWTPDSITPPKSFSILCWLVWASLASSFFHRMADYENYWNQCLNIVMWYHSIGSNFSTFEPILILLWADCHRPLYCMHPLFCSLSKKENT